MATVMPHERDANSVRKLPVDEVIRKTLQVGSMKTRLGQMEPARLFSGHGHRAAQLLDELIPQPLRNGIVMPQGLGQVLIDAGMILDSQCVRRASTF